MSRPLVFFYAVEDHEVTIEFRRFGAFCIRHDQEAVGEGRSLYGRPHHTTFVANEDGPVTYEIEVRVWGGLTPGVRIKRDGRDVVGWRH